MDSLVLVALALNPALSLGQVAGPPRAVQVMQRHKAVPVSYTHLSPHKAKLRFLSNRFVAHRVKDGLFKGYLILDSRWSPAERQEFMKIVDDTQDNTK